MKKYNILIVGLKCYSGHIREFVVNLKKKNPQARITLVTFSVRDEFKNDILKSVDQIIRIKQYHGFIKLPIIYSIMDLLYLYWGFLKLHLFHHFDIVDIHYPRAFLKRIMPIIRMMTKNIVITPWGSDVMRVDDKKSIENLCNICSQARYITVARDSMIGKYVIDKFKMNPEKMVKLGWGGEFFDFIQENSGKVTTESAKERFGLTDKFVISCGYNMQYEQRQEEIIDAIYSMKDQLPNNLLLLFPFTYGRCAQHIKHKDEITDKCKSLGLDCTVIEEYLDLADLLKLRMATDIFVHVQTTDAGSRCVMEYVYCNKKVVHGAWIKYAYLEDYKPSCYFPVDKMENLGSVIVKASQAKVEELPQEVKTIIQERGWNHKMTLWNNFFESLVS
jgi:hypothetical protein